MIFMRMHTTFRQQTKQMHCTVSCFGFFYRID